MLEAVGRFDGILRIHFACIVIDLPIKEGDNFCKSMPCCFDDSFFHNLKMQVMEKPYPLLARICCMAERKQVPGRIIKFKL